MNYDEPNGIWQGVTPCVVHRHMMDGCEPCANEMAARGAALDQMSAEANERVRGIVQQGGPQPGPLLDLQARLEVLIDSILTDPKDRIRYEGEVGRRMMLAIKNMQEQIKQPTLHVAKNMDGITPIRGGHPRRG